MVSYCSFLDVSAQGSPGIFSLQLLTPNSRSQRFLQLLLEEVAENSQPQQTSLPSGRWAVDTKHPSYNNSRLGGGLWLTDSTLLFGDMGTAFL